jgi:hypothetical protein
MPTNTKMFSFALLTLRPAAPLQHDVSQLLSHLRHETNSTQQQGGQAASLNKHDDVSTPPAAQHSACCAEAGVLVAIDATAHV